MEKIIGKQNEILVNLRECEENLVRPSSREQAVICQQFVKDFVQKSDEIRETIVEASSKNATPATGRKLDTLFDDMRNQLNGQRQKAKASLRNMDPNEQNELLKFYAGFSNFFTELFHWFKDLVNTVVEAIKKGLRMAQNFVRSIFNDVVEKVVDFFTM